jgi:stage II sporulation protein P
MRNNYSLKPDPAKLITQPLDWDLTGDAPTVLILHTHATESYTKSDEEKYQESSAYRTLDPEYNMVGMGDYLTALLDAAGIVAVHDREFHDYPSYNGSYNHARKSIAAYLKEYPTIRLVLDLHRDASGDNRNQLRPLATVDGEKVAQLMIVVGTSGSGLEHPQWKENLALGLKLHVQMERIAPGICRYVNLRSQRFNQDLSSGALLVEVGGAGNTRAEARRATEILAKGIIALSKGSG